MTIFPQIASTELGVDIDRIEMSDPDTGQVPDSGPTVASRTTMVVGKVIQEATRRLIEIIRNSCEAVSYDPDTSSSSTIVVSHSSAGTKPARTRWRTTTTTPFVLDSPTSPTPTSNGTRPSIKATPIRCTPGRPTSRPSRSISILSNTSYSIFTRPRTSARRSTPSCAKDRSKGAPCRVSATARSKSSSCVTGPCSTTGWTNYIIPTSLDAPEIHTYIVEKPFSGGPHGAKGVGELPTDGAAPAVAAALAMATGADVRETSFTPEKLQRALADS